MGGQFIYHLFLNKTQYLGSTFLYGLLARISDRALPAGVDRSCVCNHPKNWQTGHIPNCKTIIGFYISCFNFTPNGYYFPLSKFPISVIFARLLLPAKAGKLLAFLLFSLL